MAFCMCCVFVVSHILLWAFMILGGHVQYDFNVGALMKQLINHGCCGLVVMLHAWRWRMRTFLDMHIVIVIVRLCFIQLSYIVYTTLVHQLLTLFIFDAGESWNTSIAILQIRWIKCLQTRLTWWRRLRNWSEL